MNKIDGQRWVFARDLCYTRHEVAAVRRYVSGLAYQPAARAYFWQPTKSSSMTLSPLTMATDYCIARSMSSVLIRLCTPQQPSDICCNQCVSL